MSAPIWRKGSIILFIGLFWMEASPVNVEVNGCPLKIPEIKRVVVPELPQSRIAVGADKPCNPFP